MTKKSDLQQELLEKVKPGAKPSEIIKLKRSKSADDIAQIPTPPLPPNHLLSDQLKEKQKELEKLRKESETKSTTIRLLRESLERDTKESEIQLLRKQKEDSVKQITELKEQLAETKQRLDNSLEARLNSLSDFAKQYEKTKKLAQELEETITEASRELNQGDTEISQLRTKLFQAAQQVNNLQRELNLTRIHQNSPRDTVNQSPVYNDNFLTNLNYLQYGLYALMAVWFVLALNSAWKNHQINQNHA